MMSGLVRSLRTGLVLAVWLQAPLASLAQQPIASPNHWRQPIAISLDSTGHYLAVANQQSHSLSLIDLKTPADVAEFHVGQAVSNLGRLAGTDILMVTDPIDHVVRLLKWTGSSLELQHEVPVSRYPESIASSSEGTQFAVASLWSRRVTLFDAPRDGQAPRQCWQADLDFAPQEVLFVKQDDLLIVADAFGGTLAMLDRATGQVLRQRTIPAHKMSGLATTLDGQRLVVSHQMLNSLAHTIRNDVHWGLLMSNDLRWLDIEVLLSQDKNFYKDSHMHPIGQAGAGMGDPAAVAMGSTGMVAVAIAGVDQIVIGMEEDFSLQAIDVGKGPTAVEFSPDGQTLFVVNRFDDSISVVDTQQKEVTSTISLGETPELTEREIGERLFHDAKLAHDGWMSCSSCHVRGHTNGQRNDNLSDDSFGAPKRVLTLLGNAGTEPFAWNGSKESMQEQITSSIKLTMQGPRELTPAETEALALYVQSLPAPPALSEARQTADAEAIARGQAVFESLNCVRCHRPPLFTSSDVYDVGLEDEEGNREFNPPSLRGLSQRGPYFHDNRADNLEAVFRDHQHQVGQPLDEKTLADLIAYLQSL